MEERGLTRNELLLILRLVTIIQTPESLLPGSCRQMSRVFSELGIEGDTRETVVGVGLDLLNNRLRYALGEVVPDDRTRPLA